MTTPAPACFRPAWAEVDLAAVAHNVGRLREVAAPAEVCAVVKADGYGHGGVPVARAAVAAGATCLAVALVEEGIELREAGVTAPILLLSEPPTDAADEVVARGLTATVYTRAGIDALSRAAVAAGGSPVPVHLKVDTGMHRVGADAETAVALAGAIEADAALSLEAVWTHFAVADDPDDGFTVVQRRRFEAACAAIAAAGVPVRRRHAANAAGLLYGAGAADFDLVRPGIAVYGYAPNPGLPAGLRPVLSLKARVAHVRVLAEGERVSYGRRYALERESVVATVPLGYADGVPRRLAAVGGTVLVGGVRRPIAGTITMDQLMVDCGPSSPVQVGDEVVLLGRQGDATITADDWAARLDTISYEILCGIGPRVPRVYLP